MRAEDEFAGSRVAKRCYIYGKRWVESASYEYCCLFESLFGSYVALSLLFESFLSELGFTWIDCIPR